MRIRIVKANEFVAHWSAKTIFINYWYIIKPTVTWDDVKAIFEHELEEKRRFEKGDPMLVAHSKASLKEKKILNKRGLKYGPHQKEIINVYRTKATQDAPYMDLKHP